MATPTTVIMDEGVGTFLYKIHHLDEDIIVLNLDGTEKYCFLINEASPKIANLSFVDIQWYLFSHFDIDMLTSEQKQLNKDRFDSIVRNNNWKAKEKADSGMEILLMMIFLLVLIGLAYLLCSQTN